MKKAKGKKVEPSIEQPAVIEKGAATAGNAEPAVIEKGAAAAENAEPAVIEKGAAAAENAEPAVIEKGAAAAAGQADKPQKSRWPAWRIALLVLCCAVFLFSAAMLTIKFLDYYQAADDYRDVSSDAILVDDAPVLEEVEEWKYLKLDFGYLQSTNRWFKCWIDIPDTNISYPTVKYTNNSYYLNRTFTNAYHSAGTLFFDCRCNGKLSGAAHNILYGHRMRDGSMFGRLDKFTDADYFNEHEYIHFYTGEGMYVYRIYACYVASVDSFTFTFDISSASGIKSYVKNALNAASRKRAFTADGTENLITLSTCTLSDDTKRLVLQAVQTGFIEYPSYLYGEY